MLSGVNLQIPSGELVVIAGPSGCGKTTTLRIVAGLTEPDEGRVVLEGRDITNLAPEKRDVNTVFQSYALFPHMTVEENIACALGREKDRKKTRRDDRLAGWAVPAGTRS